MSQDRCPACDALWFWEDENPGIVWLGSHGLWMTDMDLIQGDPPSLRLAYDWML